LLGGWLLVAGTLHRGQPATSNRHMMMHIDDAASVLADAQ
jgi:hypothetical protein